MKIKKPSRISRLSLRFQPDPVSRNFVGLVDIIFGFLIAQGFILSKDRIIAIEISLGSGSLLLVYLAILLSWVGYHRSVTIYPYNRTWWSRIRLGMDISILLLYAYMLFVAFELAKVLFGLVTAFVFYAVTGVIRQREWSDPKVSRPELSAIMALAYAGLAYLATKYSDEGIALLIVSIALLFIYRTVRQVLGYRLLVVGVDVDGVLAEQVNPVLDRVRRAGKGKGLTKDDITDWYFKIDDTNIAIEIEAALRDPNFVSEMPVQPGSTGAMESLFREFHIVVATSRPVETQQATVAWLRKHFKFHEFASTRQVGKENLGLHVLVDDNLDNAKAFARSGGPALLFSQPWNQEEDQEFKTLALARKLVRCNGWSEVLQKIRDSDLLKLA